MESTPFSLYLDIEKGANPEFAVIARAAIHLTEALQEAAYILDPSIKIRIEFVSGTEGSLFLNSIIKSLGSKDIVTPQRLRALAMLALFWFGTHAADKIFDHLWEIAFGDGQTIAISDKDKKDIAKLVTDALEHKVAKDHVERVYGTLRADPVITGVGATTKPGKKPDDIVPRQEFAIRSGAPQVEKPEPRKRLPTPETLILVSPVLKDENRRWKFLGPTGEFGAYIKDKAFLQKLLAGKIKQQMIAGIHMEVLLQVEEEFVDGIWQIKERDIVKVLSIRSPARQGVLRLTPKRKRGKKK
jgi:hypothetical protein